MATEVRRRLPVGAEFAADRGTHFRVRAPAASAVEVLVEGLSPAALEDEGGGVFSGTVAEAAPGALYRYRLDGGEPLPDPASRFQPEGPHGPSRVVDPGAFAWTDAGWNGPAREGQVLYELHCGTFTREGTWEAAARALPRLADLGITTVEVMPVAEFPGRFGWGYDGVDLFAPTRLYGSPEDFRLFVDRAHACGLSVILDVVYNHFGPDGNYLSRFSKDYFAKEKSEWGDAPNFDGPGREAARELVVSNAAYWISEFHLDGLRIDAAQSIVDSSRTHVLAELTRAAREAAGGRRVLITAENERQEGALIREHGLDAVWNDDFHHAARVALTGRREAYYSGYRGSPQEFVSAAARGFLFQGQHYEWQKKPRGTPALDLPPSAFVHYLENHDQSANSLDGRRVHELGRPSAVRALTALLLLGPQTPLLFQGQEFGSRRPFLYFADHGGALGEAVAEGRGKYLAQFPSCAGTPAERPERCFEASKLDDADRARGGAWLALHRELLRLRREDPVFRAQRAPAGAVLGPAAFVLRFFGGDAGDRLLIVNLGAEEDDVPVESLLAPPEGAEWAELWASERPEYGGGGAAPFSLPRRRWRLPGSAAAVLRSAA